MAAARAKAKRRGHELEPTWTELGDDALLDLPLRKLNLRVAGSWVEPRVVQLHDELAERDIRLRPHVWLAEEWFAAEGVPGIAIPFYLAHPRLMRLERRMMGQAEGGTHDNCMQILRHEAGHAVDNAYKLRLRRERQRLFGLESTPYRQYYKPNPQSKRFVVHLDYWYAQAHPAEDFAETFAVWLTPGQNWHKRYRDWPALKKLEYMDELMTEIAGKRPLVANRQRVEPLSELSVTLREHYERKQSHYAIGQPNPMDVALKKLFRSRPGGQQGETAVAHLKRVRAKLRDTVAEWTGQDRYMIDQIIAELVDRCNTLKLRTVGRGKPVLTELAALVTRQLIETMYVHRPILAI